VSLAAFLTTVVGALVEAKVPFMLTGSLATAFHGRTRATQDVDLVVDPAALQLPALVRSLTAAGLYVSMDAAQEALSTGGQFNAIDPGSGWKADLIIRRSREFSTVEFQRRQPAVVLGIEVPIVTLEDLIIAKLEWSELGNSETQRRDILGLMEDAGTSLDRGYIERWVEELGLQSAWQRIGSSTPESG